MFKFKLKEEYLEILGVIDPIKELNLSSIKALDYADYNIRSINKSLEGLCNNTLKVEPYMLTRDINNNTIDNLDIAYIITYYSFYTSTFNITSSAYVKEVIENLIEYFYKDDQRLINNWFYNKYENIVKSLIYANARDAYEIFEDDYYKEVMDKSLDIQIIKLDVQEFIDDIKRLDSDDVLSIVMNEFIGCDFDKEQLQYLIITPENLNLISRWLDLELKAYNYQLECQKYIKD